MSPYVAGVVRHVRLCAVNCLQRSCISRDVSGHVAHRTECISVLARGRDVSPSAVSGSY